MMVNSFGIAITTFVGQNYGAGKTHRVHKGVRSCTEDDGYLFCSDVCSDL